MSEVTMPAWFFCTFVFGAAVMCGVCMFLSGNNIGYEKGYTEGTREAAKWTRLAAERMRNKALRR